MPVWLETPRLTLRSWEPDDIPQMASINRDRDNNLYFTRLLDDAQTHAFANEQNDSFARTQMGLMAVERNEDRQFMGYCGLAVPKFEAHFTPCVEIAWKLGKAFWGCGYATEAARAVMAYGFDTLKLNEIVALTASINMASRAVMTKLGMRHDPKDDYKHPNLNKNDRLSDLVLYRLTRQELGRRHPGTP